MQVDELGGPLGEPITVAPQQGSTDWVKGEMEVHVPPGAAAVQIWGQIIADGRAWFDDVRWQEKGSGFDLWWLLAGGSLLAYCSGL